MITAIATLPATPTFDAPAPETASVTNTLEGFLSISFTSTSSQVKSPSSAAVVSTLPSSLNVVFALVFRVSVIFEPISSLNLRRFSGLFRISSSFIPSRGVPFNMVVFATVTT